MLGRAKGLDAGSVAEAEPYLRATPVRSVTGPAPFESIVFPRIFHLRAVAAEKKGDRGAAEVNARLFRMLNGQGTAPPHQK